MQKSGDTKKFIRLSNILLIVEQCMILKFLILLKKTVMPQRVYKESPWNKIIHRVWRIYRLFKLIQYNLLKLKLNTSLTISDVTQSNFFKTVEIVFLEIGVICYVNYVRCNFRRWWAGICCALTVLGGLENLSYYYLLC